MYHVDMELPVHTGPLDLTSAQWIPAEHQPKATEANIAGLRFEANGKAVPWRRDPVDLYEYHLQIPAGASTLHVHLDAICDLGKSEGATLHWQDVTLYPAHVPVRAIAIQPTITVPAGWGIGTALQPLTPYDPQHPAGGTVQYAATTVELLQDSPVLTGLYFREYPLAAGIMPRHYVDVMAPSAAVAQLSQRDLEELSRLVRTAIAMYGPPHYSSYHFLIRLEKHNQVNGYGQEHQQSSDDLLGEKFMQYQHNSAGTASVLPHEFTHSWNGKYRRPVGLYQSDFATPMQGDLLWVYEGLTWYLGEVLGVQIGAATPEQYRQQVALDAATMDAQSGRAWRSIEDTTTLIAVPGLDDNKPLWDSWRRAPVTYYSEGTTLWLDVDMTIRRLTHDRKSLRDFLHVFFEQGGTGVLRVETYDRAGLEADLNRVAPYDWHTFFETRVYTVQPHINTQGIEQGGYRLEYTPEPTPYMAEQLKGSSWYAAWFSIGLKAEDDGTIDDVQVGSAADRAGLGPRLKITAVNGQPYSSDVLTGAVRASAQSGAQPIELTLYDEGVVSKVILHYSGGLRFPRLTRVENAPDWLSESIAPVVP